MCIPSYNYNIAFSEMGSILSYKHFSNGSPHRFWISISLISFLMCWNLQLTSVETKKVLDKIRCDKDSNGNDECACPEEPITAKYPDNTDKTCDYYWLCHLGRAIKLKCGPQYAFHPQLKWCIERNRIPRDICKPLVDCPMRLNRFVEDKKDCTKYFLCFRGTFTHWSCPEKAFFEPQSERCINDKMQAAACTKAAKKHLFDRIGFVQSPPKTSEALDEAKKLKDKMKQEEKERKNKRNAGKKG